jgi:RPA family protein
MAGNFERMKAVRLFAAELRNTAIEVPKKSADQYESQLYLTQTGLKASRVMIVGTATEIDDIGSDSSFYRMRVSDPTGVFFVTAGQYQPEAAKMMQELMAKLPAFVAVVGKISLFTTNENAVLTSIRAEQIAVVDENVRDTWLLETAKATLDRLSALEANQVLSVEVDTAYPSRDNYKELVKKVLLDMKGIPGAAAPPAASPQSPKAPDLDKLTDAEALVVRAIGENDVKGQGAAVAAVAETLKRWGHSMLDLDGIVKKLMGKGQCYEPKLGFLKLAGE